MAIVHVEPMPEWCRNTPARLWPDYQPIFEGDDVTPDDRQLALDLWRALDPLSRRFYARGGRTFAGLPLSAEDRELLDR